MDDTTSEAGSQARLNRLERRVRRQQKRIIELEQDLQESRRLHRRVAEIADVVAELLVPAMDRDDERVRTALATLGRS